MKIIDWNISWENAPEPKAEFIKSMTGDDTFIAILQEVTPEQYEVLRGFFSNIRYSLDYRKPGRFDTRQRMLGIAILCSDDIRIKAVDVLSRCLLPERTLMVDIEHNGSMLRIMGLHSTTGISHGMAKSMQFLSWAEVVDEYRPDIVAFDANEPKKDHYQIDEMEFFSQGPKEHGYGAKTFFATLNKIGLADALAVNYDPSEYIEGEPLAVSHIIKNRKSNTVTKRRYDFVFARKELQVDSCRYMYEEAVNAGSDHAMICCDYKECKAYNSL